MYRRPIPRAAMLSTMSATSAITQKILVLMCIKTTVLARMVRGLARIVAVTHGFWTMKMMPLARETATGNIAAIAARASAKPFTPAAIVTVMEAGSSIQPRSTGAKPIAGTAASRITNTPATA